MVCACQGPAAALGLPVGYGGHGDSIDRPHQAVPPFFCPKGQEQHVPPVGNDRESATPFLQPCFIYSGTLEAQKGLSSFLYNSARLEHDYYYY